MLRQLTLSSGDNLNWQIRPDWGKTRPLSRSWNKEICLNFSSELAGQIKNWQSESRLLLELMILKQVSCTGLTLSDKGLKLEISALDTLYNGHFTFLSIKPNHDSLFVANFLPTARISHFESIFQILTEIQIVFDNYYLSSPKKNWLEGANFALISKLFSLRIFTRVNLLSIP